jgi:hypothetical protein
LPRLASAICSIVFRTNRVPYFVGMIRSHASPLAHADTEWTLRGVVCWDYISRYIGRHQSMLRSRAPKSFDFRGLRSSPFFSLAMLIGKARVNILLESV